MNQKFIIIEGRFVMGRVEMHKDLVYDSSEKPIGGGWWHISNDRTKAYFYASSLDFGVVTREQFIEALNNSYIPGGICEMEIYFSTENSLSDVINNPGKIIQCDGK